MKRISTILATLAIPIIMAAQGWPANYGGVMLQGFSWDSFVDTQWSNLESQSDELSQYFDLIWVPQSGNCNTTYNVMGYAPVYWYNQNSSFGTEAQLRSLINTYKQKNVGVIADVVINHRGSVGVDGSWVDFPAETYKGTTYQMGLADICKNDDGGETAKLYDISGANDTGEDWSGMRDLDHTSTNVQQNVIDYLNFLKDDLGYAGFRYDMTKGYAAQYTALYNSTTNPTFSVGEYWDGNVNTVKNWIDGTKIDGKVQSASFDFTTRYSIRDACNGNNWSKLAVKGLSGYDDYKRYAVTFVENHDTQYRSSSSTGDPVNSFVETANAYLLSMPGTPCVFLPHWKTYKKVIKQIITARKMAGITNQSSVNELSTTQSRYTAEVSGGNGKLIFTVGSGSYTPADNYVSVISGYNYSIYLPKDVESPWIDVPSGTYETIFNVTLKALSTDANAKLVYTTDGTEPTAASTAVESGTVINILTTTTLKVGLLTGGTVKNIVTRNYEIKPFVAHQATVYVKDPGWSKMYFYAWSDAGNLNGEWPGNVVTDTKVINGSTWYYKSFDITSGDYAFNIIFNQGSNAGQTVDIGPINEDKYYEVSATMTSGKYTVTDVTSTITGIDNPTIDNAISNKPVKVYSIGGQLVRVMPVGTSVTQAMLSLDKGVYIINGRKYVR